MSAGTFYHRATRKKSRKGEQANRQYIFADSLVKSMGKTLQKEFVGKCAFFIFILSLLCMVPISVQAEAGVTEMLTVGTEKEFSYAAGDFTLEYEFCPTEDGIYNFQIAMSDESYTLDYTLKTDYHSVSSSRDLSNQQETGYHDLMTEPIIAGTKCTLEIEATVTKGSPSNGTGKILISKNECNNTLTYNTPMTMKRDNYYYFTAPTTGIYQVKIVTEEDATQDDWGRVTATYGSNGNHVDKEFYQDQTVYTRRIELEQGQSCLIYLYYNSEVDFKGEITVTEYFDNQMQAYAAGTQKKKEFIYIPKGESKILGIDVTANDMSNITYQWMQLRENDSDLPIQGATGSTYTVSQSPMELYCEVKDQYGNTEHISFSIVNYGGDIRKNQQVSATCNSTFTSFMYKFTAEQTDYYTISSTPPDYGSVNLSFYTSGNMDSEIPIDNYDWQNSFKGDIYLEEGETIYILLDSTSYGNVSLLIQSSTELGYIVIDQNTFPDTVFREYLKKEDIDWGENGILSPDEIANVEELYLNDTDTMGQIKSLEGIGKFTNLEFLNCANNLLEELDVSQNKNLEYLYCENNQLTGLDVSQNQKLETLCCEGNCLTDIDVSSNSESLNFYCSNNKRVVTTSKDKTLDLSTLSDTFNINKASNWCGGTVEGNILTFDSAIVTYSYDVGRTYPEMFTLVYQDYEAGSDDPGENNQEEQNPSGLNNNKNETEPKVPVTPSAPKTPAAGTVVLVSNETYTVKSGTEVEYKAPAAKNVKKLVIPASVTVNGVTYKVTTIAPNAFKNCKKLKEVTIGAGVTSIGKNAFTGCKNVKKVIIKSKTLTKIGKNAFKGINTTAKIKVPKNKLKAYTKLLKKAKVRKSVRIG